jgi:hypothetical protein
MIVIGWTRNRRMMAFARQDATKISPAPLLQRGGVGLSRSTGVLPAANEKRKQGDQARILSPRIGQWGRDAHAP